MIIQSPEIEHIELTAEDLFLVVACDGLWDVIDPELATRIVLQQIQLHGRGEIGAERAAEELNKLKSERQELLKHDHSNSVLDNFILFFPNMILLIYGIYYTG